MSKSGRSIMGASVALILVAALAIGLVQLPDYISRLTYAAESGRAQAAKEQLATANQLSQAFKNVVKAMRPSVVSINSVVRGTRPLGGQRGGNQEVPEEFRQFFGDDLFDRFFQAPPGSPRGPQGFEQRGMGTGVIISSDGHIVTNNHVVANASELKVTLFNGRTYTATVVGTDAKTDLAVLKIEASDLEPASFADSDMIEVGEWVLAMGSPFELIDTVTAGIVSAKGRGVGITDYEDFIQTDAAINPGNSGGPLVNARGEVVGVNTLTFLGQQSQNYAIAINEAKFVADKLKSGKNITYIGARIRENYAGLAQELGIKLAYTDGLLITGIDTGSPAAEAGLGYSDLIYYADNVWVESIGDFCDVLRSRKPGDTVRLDITRTYSDGSSEDMYALVELE